MKTSQTLDPEERRRRRELKNKKYERAIRSRLVTFTVVAAVALIALIIRIFVINAQQGDDYEISILSQQDYSSTTIYARRGTITDRNGTILATSERIYTMILDPSVILANNAKNENATLAAVNAVFGFDIADMKKTIEEKPSSAYIRYAKQLTEEQRASFIAYRDEVNAAESAKETGYVRGVWFEEDYKRVYPFGTFACNLLGFSGSDSTRGNWGLEEYYNDELVGMNGREYGYVNTDGVAERTVIPADDGNTLVSTIDYTIQAACEKVIANFAATHDADNIAAIVMNPNNGEILAEATDKLFDLNDPSNLTYCYTAEEIEAMATDEELEAARGAMWKNYAVADAYEPGSTAKPFTVAAALENGVINEHSEFRCTGSRSFGSGSYLTRVKCNNVEGHGYLDLTESLMESCNVAMMDIVAALGAEKFAEYQSIFGFGKQTSVDLPGENGGLLYPADKMGPVDLATNSFGQNFTVNMVQLASAFCSLVNGGSYYQPHTVRQILSSDGQIVRNIEPVLVRETVTEETSAFIRNALFETVENGTAKTAKITGYSIGGKTGTAEKLPRSDKKYLVSFIAAAPIDDPQVLIYVIIDNPTVDLEGGESVSAKLAIALEKEIMENIIPYINLEGEGEVVSHIFDTPTVSPADGEGQDDSGNDGTADDGTDTAGTDGGDTTDAADADPNLVPAAGVPDMGGVDWNEIDSQDGGNTDSGNDDG